MFRKTSSGSPVRSSVAFTAMPAPTPSTRATASPLARRANGIVPLEASAPSASDESWSTSCFQSRPECSAAYSRESSSMLPRRLTAMRNASSSVSPAAVRASTRSRRCDSSSSTSRMLSASRRSIQSRHDAMSSSRAGALSVVIAQSSPSASRGCRWSRLAGPDLVEHPADDRPLPAMVGERRRALRAEAIVLARPAAGRLPPFGVDVAEPLEPVQQGVEHAVAPLEFAARELGDPLQDRVAVRLALGEDAEDHRGGRRSHQVLADAHADLRSCPRGYRDVPYT